MAYSTSSLAHMNTNIYSCLMKHKCRNSTTTQSQWNELLTIPKFVSSTCDKKHHHRNHKSIAFFCTSLHSNTRSESICIHSVSSHPHYTLLVCDTRTPSVCELRILSIYKSCTASNYNIFQKNWSSKVSTPDYNPRFFINSTLEGK